MCLCVYSSEPACPLTGCVCRGPRPPSVGGPEAAVPLLRARHVTCSWARASCAAWSGSPGTWAAGRREDGDEDRKQEAAQVSSLSSVAHRTGEKARPFPPLTAGAIIHHHICQSENIKFITKIDVIVLGHPITPSFKFKPNNLILQATELAKPCEKEWDSLENNLAYNEIRKPKKLLGKERQEGRIWW